MNKLKNLAINAQIKIQGKLSDYFNRTSALMKDETGSLTVEQLLLILGAVAIVAVFIGLVIIFIKDSFFPDLTTKAKEIMNMK